MDYEIIHRDVTTGYTPEPTLTLSQLQSLLHAATELERARNTVTIADGKGLHSMETPDHFPGAAKVIEGTQLVRTPAAQVTSLGRGERSWWPIVFMVSGCAGIGSAIVTAVTGNQFAILAVFAALGVWGTATYQLVFAREA